MLKSLKVEEGNEQVTYICVHWRTFPPPGAGEDAEALRAAQILDDAQHNRLKLWEQICGLFQMQESKCLGCPHRRKVVWQTRGPALVDPKGVVTPVVDASTGEASPSNRHLEVIFRRPGTRGAYQPAAWTRDDKGDG